MSFLSAQFISSKSISLNLIKSVYERKYTFSMVSSVVDKDKTVYDTIEREIFITLQKSYNPTKIYSIDTGVKKLKLDSTKIKQEKFKQRLQKLVNKLTIITNATGAIISINNHNEVLKQWYQIKASALNTFKGATVEKYLQKLEEKISDEQKLIADLKQYRLLGFLFNGLYQDYTAIVKKQKTHLQAINYFPLVIDESYKWLEKNKNNEVHLAITGIINETQTPLKKINTYFQRKGYSKGKLELIEYGGNYKINSETGWINQANFTMALKCGEDYLKSQTISIKQI